MKEYKFDRYRLFYVSGPNDYAAKITLYHLNKRVAMIFFMDVATALPDNNVDGLPMKIYYPLGSFQDMLTILENENPLSVYVYEKSDTCEIGTRDFGEG